ncbi:PspA/IM30 family protein [Pseudovibrio sp. Alg231-02]|uniref:PspA/IM30 family protein n=1 Tax=Pseudovibrio sp. Alg231-02 TaxID=1922223 RepID=UPI00131F16C4|nr:PspA/IM30 family protein [Pseudovibrio sp. Alg231-02]
MFKQVMTLIRGSANKRSEDFMDQHALLLLRQQIKEAVTEVETMRKALALAMAQANTESKRHQGLASKIGGLEERVVTALEKGKDTLAQEGAESIAILEDEKKQSHDLLGEFDQQIKDLRKQLHAAEAQLRTLQQGQRIAQVKDSAQKLHHKLPEGDTSSLVDATATLKRLQERQSHVDHTLKAMKDLEEKGSPEYVTEKLAAAGCGVALKTSGQDVLERLRARTKQTDI